MLGGRIMYDDLINNAQNNIQRIYDFFIEKVKELGTPEVYSLNRKSLNNFCTAVAVDAGENLFYGAFKMLGITLLSLATSNPDENPQYFIFYNGENLGVKESKIWVLKQLREWYEEKPFIKDFFDKTGWNGVFEGDENILPPRVYSNSSECISFFREIIEWAKLYNIARNIHTVKTSSVAKDINFVLLRDGVLRFDNMGEKHSSDLSKLFSELKIPLIGITKKSQLLMNPLIQLWLKKHDILLRKEGFIIKLNEQFFEKASWSLSRYYDGEMRFGRYHIVRFDSYPGNCNLFIIDVPDYMDNWDEVLNIISGLKEYTSTTVFPVPGYPYPLIKAHKRAILNNDKMTIIENFLKRKLSSEHYEILKNLIEINMRRTAW